MDNTKEQRAGNLKNYIVTLEIGICDDQTFDVKAFDKFCKLHGVKNNNLSISDPDYEKELDAFEEGIHDFHLCGLYGITAIGDDDMAARQKHLGAISSLLSS